MKRQRRAAAALLATFALGFTAPLAAQSAGAGGRGSREVRDSVIVRAFGVGKIDTITTIFRSLDHEQYGSPAWVLLTKKLDSLMMAAGGGRLMLRGGAMGGVSGPPESMPRGWVGFNAQGPSQHVIDENGYRVTYLAYPSILSVDPASPADRAGILPGDVLIALNGTDVVGHEFNITRLFVPEKKVALTIRHDGESKDYSLDVVKAPEGVFNRRMEFNRMPGPMQRMPDGVMRIEVEKGDRGEVVTRRVPTGGAVVTTLPRAVMTGPLMAGRFMVVSAHGVFGASVSPVGADLAKVLKLEKGMLVNEVPELSPAYKAGLRIGDVIVNVAGQPIVTLSELQDQILTHLGDRSVALQIVRDRKPGKITVTW